MALVPERTVTDGDGLPREDALPRPYAAPATRVLEVAASCARRGVSGVMATVFERHGSAPGTPGQKLYLAADGTCLGTVGGGAVEREILTELAAMIGDVTAAHRVRELRLGQELGMCCGGRVVIALEPIACLVPCLLVGAGHVATATAPLLAKVGFAVTVADSREAWSEGARIPDVRTIHGDYDDVARDFDRGGVFLVMTHDHALDQRAIEWALKKGFAFVGGVGSRAKAERTRQRLAAKGFSEEDCGRVRMPVGVSVGARLPDEIAVAIAAELVAWRTQRR